jgi:hypothetical protein
MRNLPTSGWLAASILAKSCDCRSQVRLRRVPELVYQRMLFECLLDDPALNAFSPSMNEPYLSEPGLVGGSDVLFDHRSDVTRSKGVQVERILDRDPVGHWWVIAHGVGCVAVTTVLMPPRTEKSPTTVMRRGWQAATRSSRIWFVTAS